MFASRQQLVRQTLQRVSKRSMGGAAAEAAVYPKPTPLAPPLTPEQKVAIEQFAAEFREQRAAKMALARPPIFNPKYEPYTQSELFLAGAVPKYSRPFYDILGRKRAARVFWLFPLYFTVVVVGNTYVVEYLGSDIYIRPFLALMNIPRDAV